MLAKPVSQGTIDQPVIIGDGKIAQGADADAVFNHYRRLLNRTDAQEANVRLVDNPRGENGIGRAVLAKNRPASSLTAATTVTRCGNNWPGAASS